MKWQAMLLMLGFMRALLHTAFATEVCMHCRPLELQRAPGLGIDLSMTHSTASLRFRNGTIIDVVEVPGSADYVLAMKTLAEDARRVRFGGQLLDRPDILHFFDLQFNYPKTLRIAYQVHRNAKPIHTILEKPEHWAQPITTLLSTLKSAIEDAIPLAYPLIMLSIPDFEADTGHIYKPLFESACQQAGFELLHPVTLASRATLMFYDIKDCYDGPNAPDEYCPVQDKRIDVVLAVTYNKVSLGVTLLTRWMADHQLWGTIWPRNLSEAVDLGHGSSLRVQDPDQYWRKVKQVIMDIVGNETIDRVIFLGSHGDNQELRKVVGGIAITPIEGQLKVTGEDTAKECLFVAARGAAVVARLGMKSGFDGCLVPDWCQIDDNGDLREDGALDMDVTAGKTEL